MTARVRLFWAARDGSIVDDDRKQKTDAPSAEIRALKKLGGDRNWAPPRWAMKAPP